MPTHKRDLQRHPITTEGGAARLHDIVVATEGDSGLPSRLTLFVDGREMILPAHTRINTSRTINDFAEVTFTIWAETLSDITWEEMEARASKE